MVLKVGNITFDCDDALAVATFWSEALGRALDPGASPDYASIGGADPDRDEVSWYFERVPESKVAKNRVHLDLVDPDPATVERLVSLGAKVLATHEIGGGSHSWTVLQDPGGNEFCVSIKSYTG
ncbi:MAG TPA: VOC family protein [Acidimicrobiales bacterium]|nr:VOC family protein [Acidimicrobiales bacterium]